VRNVYKVFEIFVGEPQGKRSFGRTGVDGMIILNRVRRCGLNACGSG
jgi:hypothetical protein